MMDIVKYLQSIEEQYAGKPTHTGEVRIDHMANMCWREIKALQEQVASLQGFKDLFSDLYGQGLEIIGWHSNGTLESFDNFYDDALAMIEEGGGGEETKS